MNEPSTEAMTVAEALCRSDAPHPGEITKVARIIDAAFQSVRDENARLLAQINAMQQSHHRDIHELERSVGRELTEAHREGYEEGRREAQMEFGDRS